MKLLLTRRLQLGPSRSPNVREGISTREMKALLTRASAWVERPSLRYSMKLLLHLVAVFFVALVLNAPATVCPTQSRTHLAALARSANSHQQSAVDPWWKHAVIYEICPRSFQDSDGDGVGDLN